MEDAQCQLEPRSLLDLRGQFLQPLLHVIHVLGGKRSLRQEQKGFVIGRLLLQNVNGFVARLFETRQIQTGQSQLQPHVEIIRL